MDVHQQLKELVGMDVVLTRRGNAAIKEALEICKKQGKTKVIIQDQGGWLTYKQFPAELGFEVVEVRTDVGIPDRDHLHELVDDTSVFLVNSMPGYHCPLDMGPLYELCHAQGCIVINDSTATIGDEGAMVGDIVVGSFGKWKPLDVGYGGFIATSLGLDLQDEFDSQYLPVLEQKLKGLHERKATLWALCENVKNDLAEFEIVHKAFKGFVVLARFINKSDKPALIAYCERNNLPYTLCPRYIRMNHEGISIEIKRL